MSFQNENKCGPDSPYDMKKILRQGGNALREIQQNSEALEMEHQRRLQESEMKKLAAENEDKGVAERLHYELVGEEVALKMQAEEKEAEIERLKQEESDAKLARDMSRRIEAAARESEAQDEELARVQQQLYDLLAAQEAVDAQEAQHAARRAEERELAEAKAQEAGDAARAARLGAAAAREAARAAAHRRLVADVEEGKDMTEEETVVHEVFLWKQPNLDFIEIDGCVQIAAYLPHLRKLNVPLYENKQGVVIAAEREPLAYAEGLALDPALAAGGNPLTCQALLKIAVPCPAGLRQQDIQFEYDSGLGTVFVYVANAKIQALSAQGKHDLLEDVRRGARRLFTSLPLRRRASSHK